MPAAKDWNPESISTWVHEFLWTHDRVPHMRDMDSGGPNRRNRRIYGGVAGVLAVAGVSAASYGVKRYYNKKELIEEVLLWAENHGPTDRQIQQADLHAARDAGLLSFHPDTIGNHFESWKDFLIEAGIAQYHWSPAECVQFARKLTERYHHGKLEKLVDKFGIDGKTPGYADFTSHFPNIKSFMFYRVRWENWQPNKKHSALRSCWVGYAALALVRSEGDTAYIAKEMDAMARIGLGPGYDLDLIGQLDPQRNPRAVGIWLQDQAVEIHEGLTCGKRDGSYLRRVHNTFIPELSDAYTS